MSSNPFEPPKEVPAPLPPNRAKPTNAYRTLALWIVLILAFVVIWQMFPAPPPKSPPSSPVNPVDTASATSPWAWAIPGTVYGWLLLALVVFRSKLPARYRTFELRTATSPATPNADEPAQAPHVLEEIRLDGSDGERKIHLEVNDTGIHWHADRTAFLHGENVLHVSWDELESVSTGYGSYAVAWLFAISAILTGVWVRLEAGLVVALIAGGSALWERRRPSGTFSFVTPTHSLAFRSRQIDAAMSERLLHAIRIKRPTLAPQPGAKQNGVFRLLFVEPFVRYAEAFLTDAALDAKQASEALAKQDAETRVASRIQLRMYSLWAGTMCGVGPLASGLGAALYAHEALGFAVGWCVAWVVGLILINKLLEPFARFSGILVHRPNKS